MRNFWRKLAPRLKSASVTIARLLKVAAIKSAPHLKRGAIVGGKYSGIALWWTTKQLVLGLSKALLAILTGILKLLGQLPRWLFSGPIAFKWMGLLFVLCMMAGVVAVNTHSNAFGQLANVSGEAFGYVGAAFILFVLIASFFRSNGKETRNSK